MSKLSRITFVALDGDAPPDQILDILPPATRVLRVVRRAFEPFLENAGDVHTWDGKSPMDYPSSGLHLVYAYGHAWLTPRGPEVAWRADGSSVVGDAAALAARLVPAIGADRHVLVLDCCHAAAFDPHLVATHPPRMLIYACGAGEQAIALVKEQASRLSIALADEIALTRNVVDLAQIVANVADKLDGDGVLRGQSVSYRMHGPAVRLVRDELSWQRQRERTVTRVRNTLLAVGATVAVMLTAATWFYWSHVLIEIDLAGLPSAAANVRLVAHEDDPTNNSRKAITEQEAGHANHLRVWAPASNLVLQVRADYADGAERALHFHLVLTRSFDPRHKTPSLKLPPVGEVLGHPDMAYVPVTPWFHGREREPRTNSVAYWIDLRPPTVEQYMVVARRLLAIRNLEEQNSYVLSWHQRDAAIDAVGLQQLRPLNRALGEIFGVVEAAHSQRVAAPGDIVVGLGALPCAQCPAPMTRLEAGLYCASRGMRVPTDLEWELAVRGVDGRIYPWGNRFDEARANVPGLPKKGEAPPGLKPVEAYASERSPFGLVDTVGNAGDWVVNESGSYERVYMGATYRFNQEDATTFRMRPVTEEDAFIREITVRCAIGAPS